MRYKKPNIKSERLRDLSIKLTIYWLKNINLTKRNNS